MMDSHKASSSMTNSVKPECDGEKNKNYKSTPKQAGPSDTDEKLFTSTPNPTSNFVPLNGSHSRVANAVSHDSNSQSSENAAESYNNLPSTSNSLSTSKVTSNDCLNETVTASSSRSSLSTNNGVETDEVQACNRHKVCMGDSSNAPSTSGTSRADNDNIVLKENRKRPSSLKLNRPDVQDDSSSDTGNDDYSLGSEDGCIYTYRGGEHLADLPSSFFSLDMGLPLDRHLVAIGPNFPVIRGVFVAGGHRSRASSPDMDFLEMDFDPGPSCEVDAGDESMPDVEMDADVNMPEENEPVVNVVRGTSPEHVASPVRSAPAPASLPVGPQGAEVLCHAVASTSHGTVASHGDAATEQHQQHTWFGPYITHVNARGEQLMVRRTMMHWAAPGNLHTFNGDLVQLQEVIGIGNEYPVGSVAYRLNGGRPLYDLNPVPGAGMFHLIMAKKLLADKQKEETENQNANANVQPGEPVEAAPISSTSSISCVEPPRCMIWSEREACERQVTQIGTSACGATAVVNVFIALGVPVNLERINSSVATRLRANTAPVPRYLLARAVAGCTGADLVNGIQRASDGLVTARFFGTYPERAMSLSHWLADWISLGAVPILTQNLQNGCDGEVPDAWHHQMVFGVSSRGVYLCNPVECIRETVLWPRLAAPSTLLVRASDVALRFTNTTDLSSLLHVPDPRFESFNVIGQVVNVIREWSTAMWQEQCTRTRHVRIPAAYRAGITIAALTGSEAHRRLTAAASLPLLHPQNDPA